MSNGQFLSRRLETWLKSAQPKTVADLVAIIDEKSFAVSLVVLMFVPALPLPTGGVTHIFEIIAMLLSIELILGRKTIWLPNRLRAIDISGIGQRKTVASLIKILKWVETHSKPRLKPLINNGLFLQITGLVIGTFCFTAFVAPPFSGLDTLPSLGVVLIALSLLFEDIFLYIAGLAIGAIGIGTAIFLGIVLFRSFQLWL